MGGHHLILGTLEDVLTGQTLDDTLDERFRQSFARLLVERKGFEKGDITPRIRLMVQAGDKKAVVPVDFAVRLEGRVCMVVKYGPGSLVTRHQPAIGISRLLEAHQIPVVVVTNGVDAHVLDGESGRLMATGLDAVPSREDLAARTRGNAFASISRGRADMAARVVYCYEVDGSCPCDDTVCRL